MDFFMVSPPYSLSTADQKRCQPRKAVRNLTDFSTSLVAVNRFLTPFLLGVSLPAVGPCSSGSGTESPCALGRQHDRTPRRAADVKRFPRGRGDRPNHGLPGRVST